MFLWPPPDFPEDDPRPEPEPTEDPGRLGMLTGEDVWRDAMRPAARAPRGDRARTVAEDGVLSLIHI
ncbi:MAG: hypothetical protein QUU85_10335 [Candidatus Eisenbacteria bacterium]|nr:hypothetical protein [Candidatus Eisenbacteria bacterium]